MLEMKVFRESPEKIFEDLEKRNLPKDIALSVIDLDNKWRKLIEKGNRLRAKRNTISKTIGELKKKEKDGRSKSIGERSADRKRRNRKYRIIKERCNK